MNNVCTLYLGSLIPYIGLLKIRATMLDFEDIEGHRSNLEGGGL